MFENGSWIFLSHSSHDIEKVRKIRNEFERLGHNPLAFHLKCLSDDTKEGEQELYDLIKREIEVRDWFVYCDSPAAQKSKYVNEERDYIESLDKEKVFAIDIMTDINDILEQVKKISSHTQQRVSFARADQEQVKSFIQALNEKDYSVLLIEMDKGDEDQDVSDVHEKSFSSVSNNVIISENSVKEPGLKEELNYLESNGIPYTVIIMGGTEIPEDIQKYIKQAAEVFVINDETKDFKAVVEVIDGNVAEQAAKSRLTKYAQLINDSIKNGEN